MTTNAKHLVNAIENCTLEDARARVTAVLAFLKTCLEGAASGVGAALQKPSWATDLKRVQVEIKAGKPGDVGLGVGARCNLVEVLNQVATMQRLHDVLQWGCNAGSGLSEYKVLKCHPTTSSDKKNEDDNDLVLVDNSGRKRAHFEVSDVVGTGDGNGKLLKDLRSLQAIDPMGKTAGKWLDNAKRRLFLVTSPTFGRYAKERKNLTCIELHAINQPADGTWICEVKRKRASQ